MSALRLLEGIRVVELASPRCEYAGKLLADFGADVIIVEPPEGAPSRKVPPFLTGWEKDLDGSLHWQVNNSNKRSIILDWKSPAEQETLEKLFGCADAVIDGEQPSQWSSLDMHPREWVRRKNIVWASITGFGHIGSYQNFKDPDIVCFAMGGLMYISGKPEGPPVAAPELQAYKVAATHTAFQVLVSLRQRSRTGVGDWLDVAAQQCLAAQENMITEYTGIQKITRRAGSQHIRSVPGRIYPCKDGYVHIMISVAQPGSWERFLEWIGNPVELREEKWKDILYRRENAEFVDAITRNFTKKYSKGELYQEAQRRHLPCAPVNNMKDFCEDEQIMDRGFAEQIAHKKLGLLKLPWGMFRFSEANPTLRFPAPMLGEHTEEVFAELGVSTQNLINTC